MTDNKRKFKTISYNLELRSDAINNFVKKQLPSLIGGLGRIAQLLVLTKNDKEVNSAIKALVKEVADKTQKELELFDEKLNALIEGVDLFSDEIEGPAQTYKIDIGHPILFEGIRIVKDIEERALSVELFWLNGILTDEERELAEKTLNTEIRRYVTSIYNITNVKNREGGKYSAKAFLESLKQEKQDDKAA